MVLPQNQNLVHIISYLSNPLIFSEPYQVSQLRELEVQLVKSHANGLEQKDLVSKKKCSKLMRVPEAKARQLQKTENEKNVLKI